MLQRLHLLGLHLPATDVLIPSFLTIDPFGVPTGTAQDLSLMDTNKDGVVNENGKLIYRY